MSQIKQEPVDENYGNFSMANSDWTLNTSGSDQDDTILHGNEVKIEIPDELTDEKLTKEQYQKEIAELKDEVENLKKAEMEKNELIKQMQQQMDVLARENANLKKQQQPKETMNVGQLIKVANPLGNRCCNYKNKQVTISTDGLNVKNNTYKDQYQYVVGMHPFRREYCQKNYAPGTVLHYYFEVKQISSSKSKYRVGVSHSCCSPFYYLTSGNSDYCNFPAGRTRDFDWPNGAIKPEWNGKGDILGCGLLLNSNNEFVIIFTVNGILMGNQITLTTQPDHLFPTLQIWPKVHLEVNFGDNPAKAFAYDIASCPGLAFWLNCGDISSFMKWTKGYKK